MVDRFSVWVSAGVLATGVWAAGIAGAGIAVADDSATSVIDTPATIEPVATEDPEPVTAALPVTESVVVGTGNSV